METQNNLHCLYSHRKTA